MPLPAARHAMPDVGATGDQGSRVDARPHPQVGGRAVSLSTGKFVRAMCERFDAATFEAFLKKLLRHRSRGKRMVVVLDNAKHHHAILLKPLLRKYRAVLTLLFLPPYSPQLAPIDRVWKLARRMATHNRFFATLNELLAAVDQCFDRWRKPNSVLRRLCGTI